MPLDENDDLMTAIRDVIIEVSENVDRTFVYVAFQQGTLLISNDLRHIVRGPADEPRAKTHKVAKQHGGSTP